jgi:hypothetical protein
MVMCYLVIAMIKVQVGKMSAARLAANPKYFWKAYVKNPSMIDNTFPGEKGAALCTQSIFHWQ